MSRQKTVDAARGRWRGILLHFGLDPKFLDGKHGPCPFCQGKDRFRWDDKDGTGSFFCSQCGAGSGMTLLEKFKGWDFAQTAREVDAILGNVQADQVKAERTDQQKRASLRSLLQHSKHLQPGMPPWFYLERRCGDPTGLVADLRYHPALRHCAEDRATYPAMLATLRFPDGKGASVHRTYLTPEGQKAAVDPVRKIMPGFPLEGAAVRLGGVQERLGIAEGIETALCAGKLSGVPCWAGISANGILSWQPPEGVKSVVIFADNDSHFVGQEAAYRKARALHLKGYDVEVQVPPRPDSDWADVWAAMNQLQGVA